MTNDRTCIDCGWPLAPSKTRPALRCPECNRVKRRVKKRRSVTCVDCQVSFQPPAETGKLPVRCEPCALKHRRKTGAAKVAVWRAANLDRQRKYDREYQAKRRLDPEFRQRRNEFEIIRKHGITHAELDAMIAKQNGECAICHGGPNGPGTRLHIDHCHDSKKIRGLLCGKCNTAIGLLDDDPARAESAAAYLRR